MPLELNRYYKIIHAGPEAIRLSVTLLQFYPITRACLGILGKALLGRIEFGFFSENTNIIKQGEIGRDLFLLCSEVIDVFVNGQRVVQMDAPALFGDKGIVEPKSTRAATIRVSENHTCFFIKIPMGLFIRNFDDLSIPDKAFEQETGIFYNMFKGIQSRLFEYAFIQKNLWEEVNTTLNILNTQQILKTLDNRIDQGWDKEIWNVVRKHLAKELSFNWPEEVPLDISTFRNILREHLDQRFTRIQFKGEDAEYIRKKHQIWRKWLTSTARAVLKELPEGNLPANITEIQLFNPRNYQLRIQGLIKAIEKKFLANKKRDSQTDASNGQNEPGIKSFFGRSGQNNFFDLNRYLYSFEKKYELRHPKRMQTQIAQRTALIAAKCENEFNATVAKMKEFLKETQRGIDSAYRVHKSETMESLDVSTEIKRLTQGVAVYNKHYDSKITNKIGVISYKAGISPTISHVIKVAASKSVRIELDKTFRTILSKLNIQSRLLPLDFIQKRMYICEGDPGFIVPTHELEKNYWIPLSKGIYLKLGDQNFGVIPPGSVIGGKGWLQNTTGENGDVSESWQLKIPERQPEDPKDMVYMLLVLPQQKIPWENNPLPKTEEFKRIHLPAMQWLINKQIEHIRYFIPKRDEVFRNWVKTEHVVKLENKVKVFENTKMRIPPEQQLRISNLLKNVVGLELEETRNLASDQLSKKIYNYILQQMMIDYSDVPIEQLGNKTYTKWRLILSEIIQITEQSDTDATTCAPTPIFEIIETELISMLKNFSLFKYRKFIQLTHHTPYLQFPKILSGLEDPDQDRLLLFYLTQSILETYLRLLYEEIQNYRIQYEKAYAKRPQSDAQSIQIKEILETADKLKQIVSKEFQKQRIK